MARAYLGVPRDPALCALGLVAQALVCASLGTLIAVFRKALEEDFAVIMNFVIFPVFFLSADGRPYWAAWSLCSILRSSRSAHDRRTRIV